MGLRINGEEVDDSVIRREADVLRARLVEAGETDELSIGMQAWEWARENVIATVLLRQAALEETSTGEPLPEEVSARRVEVEARVERFLARLTAKAARPTRAEIGEYYRCNRDSFHGPEMVHAAHIVKNVDVATIRDGVTSGDGVANADAPGNESDARAAITAILSELHAGRRFEELADERSDCPGRGGDLGWFARGQMVEEFDAAVFGMRAGEVSGVFRSPFGFHIAKVHARKPEGILPLKEVRGAIESALYRQRNEETIAQFVAGLRSQARIERVARHREAGSPEKNVETNLETSP